MYAVSIKEIRLFYRTVVLPQRLFTPSLLHSKMLLYSNSYFKRVLQIDSEKFMLFMLLSGTMLFLSDQQKQCENTCHSNFKCLSSTKLYTKDLWLQCGPWMKNFLQKDQQMLLKYKWICCKKKTLVAFVETDF